MHATDRRFMAFANTVVVVGSLVLGAGGSPAAMDVATERHSSRPARVGVADSMDAHAGRQATGPTQRRTQNVVLVTLDGLRWQEVFGGADDLLMNEEAGNVDDVEALAAAFWRNTPEERRQALMPFLWSVMVREGQLFGDRSAGSSVRVTNRRYFSYPGYSEMLVGYPDDRIDSNDKVANANAHVLEWLNARAGFAGRIAAFTSWDVFPFILNEERSGIPVNAGWELIDDAPLSERQRLLNELVRNMPQSPPDLRPDVFTFYAALEHLRRHEPRVLYIALDETDTLAHRREYGLYLAAAHRADRLLSLLWAALEAMPSYAAKTTLLVTSDHGRGHGPADWTDHGVDVRGAEYIWFGALGPDTAAGGTRHDVADLYQGQVASTIAALLGEDYRAAVPAAAPPIDAVLGGGGRLRQNDEIASSSLW